MSEKQGFDLCLSIFVCVLFCVSVLFCVCSVVKKHYHRTHRNEDTEKRLFRQPLLFSLQGGLFDTDPYAWG